jgi:hypothetical protein
MRYMMSIALLALSFPTGVAAREVTVISPLALAVGQPLRITGMDLDFAPKIVAEVAESDA